MWSSRSPINAAVCHRAGPKNFSCRSRNAATIAPVSGLGLSISRRAVHAIGGTLALRDVPGTGCIFTISLSLS
jgi:signal transduction histidine kinase